MACPLLWSGSGYPLQVLPRFPHANAHAIGVWAFRFYPSRNQIVIKRVKIVDKKGQIIFCSSNPPVTFEALFEKHHQ